MLGATCKNCQTTRDTKSQGEMKRPCRSGISRQRKYQPKKDIWSHLQGYKGINTGEGPSLRLIIYIEKSHGKSELQAPIQRRIPEYLELWLYTKERTHVRGNGRTGDCYSGARRQNAQKTLISKPWERSPKLNTFRAPHWPEGPHKQISKKKKHCDCDWKNVRPGGKMFNSFRRLELPMVLKHHAWVPEEDWKLPKCETRGNLCNVYELTVVRSRETWETCNTFDNLHKPVATHRCSLVSHFFDVCLFHWLRLDTKCVRCSLVAS